MSEKNIEDMAMDIKELGDFMEDEASQTAIESITERINEMDTKARKVAFSAIMHAILESVHISANDKVGALENAKFLVLYETISKTENDMRTIMKGLREGRLAEEDFGLSNVEA